MYSICVDARMLFSGGIGTYIRNLIPFIGKTFHLQLLIAPTQELPQQLKQYETISVNAGIYSIREQLLLPLLVPACDLFWSPHYNVPLLPLRARKKVVTIHDVYHLVFASSLNLLEKTYAKIVMNRAVTASDRVITVSHFSAKELSKYTNVSQKKLAVIHSGIDAELFTGNSSPNKRRYFLFVGNFKPHKNLKGIVEAFRLFLMDEDADLVLVGKRKGMIHQEQIEILLDQAPTVKKKTQILENVTDEHLPGLYAGAEALLFPSFYEGFGFPPLEALASGCPVIVSDIEVLREICQEATCFVNPWNPHDIKDKMLQIWKKKDLLQQEKGKKWAAGFSWRNAAEKHIQLFEEECK